MKTRLFFAALLLLAFGTMKAQNEASQVKVIRITGSGDVMVSQTPGQFSLMKEGEIVSDYRVESNLLLLSSSDDYEVEVSQLENIQLLSSADVICKNTIKGDYINVYNSGSGDMVMKLDYDTVHVIVNGSGDIILEGRCKVLEATLLGSGDLVANGMKADDSYIDIKGSGEAKGVDAVSLSELMAELNTNLGRLSDTIDWKSFEAGMEQWGKEMEEWGRKMEKWGERFEDKQGGRYEYNYGRPNSKADGPKDRRPVKKNLLFDANWNGFEAGLNMLFNTPADVVNTNNGAQGMEIRPLRSWYFGFNIADVGVAFDRRHRVGLFTGVGLGWNNFSWNNNIKIEYNPDNVVYTLVPIESEQVVKNSKYGALFLQMPLMLEVRPTRSMYIDAGVTGGLRIAQWNRVKLEDGTQSKRYYGASINQFKLDASLRVGGENIGFCANYALLPIFDMSNAKVRPINFGFSINF